MRHFQRAAIAALAGLAGLAAGGTAGAQQGETYPDRGTAEPGEPQGKPPAWKGSEAKPGPADYGARNESAGTRARGTLFVLAPLDTAAGMGAGIGGCGGTETGANNAGEPGRAGAAAAPVPQYWLADASLFVANAGNAAQTLANEQNLQVQAPGVLSNQAQFMIAATDRALSSLAALQANAEATNPTAVGDIHSAMNQLNAARAQQEQTLEAANAGTLGPGHMSTVRSTYQHLQAAERAMAGVGRAYGAPGFTLAWTGVFKPGRAFGAGIGGGQKAPEGAKAPDSGSIKAPEPTPPPAPPMPPAEKP